jgi:hypothetical protein
MDTDLLKVILTVGVLMLIFEVGIITWDTGRCNTTRPRLVSLYFADGL